MADAEGRLVVEVGEVERPVFSRSSVKALQALPLIESGAADQYGFSDAELALACGSHGGEPEHVETAAGALARLGLGADALQCGAHWPLSGSAARALAAAGQAPSRLHNCCSGKHAGFLCLACARGDDVAGYLALDHPVQQAVRSAIAETTGHDLSTAPVGVDGCGAATYALPLRAIALGFARFGSGLGLPPARAEAARRLMRASWSSPTMIGGARRFDTETMRALPERAFVKSGAEGVYVAALPELGLGVAVKIDDGAERAAEAAMAATLAGLLAPAGEAAEGLAARMRKPLVNAAGERVGEVRAVDGLLG